MTGARPARDATSGGATAGHVAGYPLPALLRDSDDPEVQAWREGLPEVVGDLLERWQLRAAAPFEPGGSSAWVTPVRDASGAELVLKVAFAHAESRDEVSGIRAWQGLGAAGMHRSELCGETAALLMERVRPGTPLAELLTWPERDEVIAGLARRLWKPPSELVDAEVAAAFRPLSEMCALWADEAQQDAESGLSPLPRDLVDQGLHWFRELPAQWDGEAVLLATDLHPQNVLAADSTALDGAFVDETGRRWALIDPKPYVGDPHYDVLQHMFNDPERLRSQPGAFADRMATLTGLDPARVRQWLFARCVQEAGALDSAAEAALSLAPTLRGL